MIIGLALAASTAAPGCDPGSRDPAAALVDRADAVESAPAAAPSQASELRVPIVADGRGFSPNQVNVPRGTHTTLLFKRTTNETCATAVVFPALRIERELPLGQEVAVEVPTGERRTLVFQCGMGMYRSRLVVQ